MNPMPHVNDVAECGVPGSATTQQNKTVHRILLTARFFKIDSLGYNTRTVNGHRIGSQNPVTSNVIWQLQYAPTHSPTTIRTWTQYHNGSF